MPGMVPTGVETGNQSVISLCGLGNIYGSGCIFYELYTQIFLLLRVHLFLRIA